MKRCPACGRTFTNNTLINCLNDGTPLAEDMPAPPPYFGAPPPAASTEPPSAEPPPAVPDTPGTLTYTNTPLSAIPELQSPEMQAALKEALDKAGMSSLFGADLSGKSTVSVTTSTSTTTSGAETPFASAQTPPQGFTLPPGYAQTPPAFTGASPYYAGAAAPRRKRSPWVGLIIAGLVVFLVVSGVLSLLRLAQPGVPADIVAAVKSADAAEAQAVSGRDPTPLASTYTGPALAQEISRLASLRNANTTVDEKLISQKFGAFKTSANGSEAQVEVTETWNTTTYSEPAHTVVKTTPDDVNPQTVTLKRTPNGWIVEKIEFHHS